jgi:hypothetical protein
LILEFIAALTHKKNPDFSASALRLLRPSLEPGVVPEHLRNTLSRYPFISSTPIGRLTIVTSFQGRGLGGALLARVYETTFDCRVVDVVVDADRCERRAILQRVRVSGSRDTIRRSCP